jgi:hypothetical protein
MAAVMAAAAAVVMMVVVVVVVVVMVVMAVLMVVVMVVAAMVVGVVMVVGMVGAAMSSLPVWPRSVSLGGLRCSPHSPHPQTMQAGAEDQLLKISCQSCWHFLVLGNCTLRVRCRRGSLYAVEI